MYQTLIHSKSYHFLNILSFLRNVIFKRKIGVQFDPTVLCKRCRYKLRKVRFKRKTVDRGMNRIPGPVSPGLVVVMWRSSTPQSPPAAVTVCTALGPLRHSARVGTQKSWTVIWSVLYFKTRFRSPLSSGLIMSERSVRVVS